MLRTTTPYRPAPKRPPAFRASSITVYVKNGGYYWSGYGNAQSGKGQAYRTPALAMLAARAAHDAKTLEIL